MKLNTTDKPKASFGLLLVGAPKSGKTSFALQFPKPYIADCDNNISGPQRFLEEKNLKPQFFYDVIDIDEQGKEVQPAQRWTRLTNGLKVAVASSDVETIIVDSLSKLSDNLVEHIMGFEKIQQMRIQDWMSYQNLMKKLITYLRSSGKYVVFIAHEGVEKDELDGVLKYFVSLPSKLRDTIGGMFTDVWRAEYQPGAGGKEGQYTVRALSSARMSLGNSLGLPPSFPMDYEKEIKPRLEKL
jgi:hypothetical protein